MLYDNFFNDLKNKKKKIAIIGLGYVGIPLLVKLGKYFRIIGFDVNKSKLENIRNGENIEDFPELGELNDIDYLLTSNEEKLQGANFFIVTVPTPIDNHNKPDLRPVISATEIIGRNMPEGSIIVYESTVYPGLTEDICIPLLEKHSGYKNGAGFRVGYSPERINPGDKAHTLESIVKIVSAQDEITLEIIENVYSSIIKAGVYKAESIKVAEAAKVIENIQRDLNIALVNELAMIFKKMNIDSNQVFNAAGTKWNFLDFRPGGYHPEIILAGRRINEKMSLYIGNEIIKNLLKSSRTDGTLKIVLFGITFKENVKDIRNSKVIDLYNYLKQYGIDIEVCDPIANKEEVYNEYGIKIIGYEDVNNMDAAVFCVSHDDFKQIDLGELRSRFKNNNPYIFDIKGIFDNRTVVDSGFNYWRL